MKRKKRIFLATGAVIVAAVAAGVFFYTGIKADGVLRDSDIYIPTGADYAVLTDSLQSSGAIKNMSRLHTAARLTGLTDNVRPGRYRLKKGMGYTGIARMFQRGLQSPVTVTFNNVRTLPQLAGKIARQIEPDSLTMLRALTADSTASAYGFDKRTFIDMFIPNTYEFYWNTTPESFIERMKKEYDKFWNEERSAKLALTGLTREQAVTLASIVYEETKMSDEMATVAGVYMNRLRVGMPLQADPTVKFAVGDFTLRRILNRHLTTDSPYNTYKYAGLPPGPIAMPSISAIDAVLDYRKHRYIYFAAKPDFSGYHNFAVTLAEHNRNADAYRRALNARGIR